MEIIKNTINLKENKMKRLKLLWIFILLLGLVGCGSSTQYTIRFQSNEGSSVASIIIDGMTLPSLAESNREGYSFDGWYFDNDTFVLPVTQAAIQENPIVANITIFAKWIPNSYTIFFEENGGSLVDDMIDPYKTPIILPIPVREYFDFNGWYMDEALTIPATYEWIPLGNQTLYASWEPTTYTITFDEAGGTDVENIVGLANELICAPIEPTRPGFVFDGWYEDLLSEAFVFTQMPTRDLTLIAKWIVDSTYITFDTNGGSDVAPLAGEALSPIHAPVEPIRDGYSFGGWFTDASYQYFFRFDTMPVENLTLFAKWNQNPSLQSGNADAMRSIGYAYFYQGVQMQYDQGTGRRMVQFSPELATSDYYLFMDCSSFANAVYQYAFGINVTPTTTFTSTNTYSYMDYAMLNQGTSSEVIYYIENANYSNTIDQISLLSTIWASLQPGDLIVYRRDNNNAGHVMMYVGDNMFIHSTGSDYNYTYNEERFENSGTVLELAASELFVNTNSSRYLFKSNFNRFCVLRPMNREGIELTSSAISRYHLEGLDIEKTCSVPNLGSVQLGDEITYTIHLENKGFQNLGYFQVSDQVGSYATLVDANYEGDIIDDHVYFYMPGISARSTITLQYTVQITSDEDSSGEVLASDQGKLDEIILNPLYHTLIKLSEDDLLILTQKIFQTIQSKTYTASIDLLKSIYQEFSEEIDAANPLSSYTALTPIYNSLMSVYLLYGGKAYNQNSAYNCEAHVRYLIISQFCVGDILFLYSGSSFAPLIYNGTRFVYLDVAGGLVKQYATTQEINDLLDSAQGYQGYRVIRPILEM